MELFLFGIGLWFKRVWIKCSAWVPSNWCDHSKSRHAKYVCIFWACFMYDCYYKSNLCLQIRDACLENCFGIIVSSWKNDMRCISYVFYCCVTAFVTVIYMHGNMAVMRLPQEPWTLNGPRVVLCAMSVGFSTSASYFISTNYILCKSRKWKLWKCVPLLPLN